MQAAAAIPAAARAQAPSSGQRAHLGASRVERLVSVCVLAAVAAAIALGWLHRHDSWIDPERGFGYGLGIAGATLAEVRGMPAPVVMRPQAVTRAVENLVSNARRYGKRVEISLWFREGSLWITVEDDGPGIPPEKRDEALRPFTRLDASRDPNQGGGVGLGLSIASDIALSHGGALRLGQSARLGGLKAELTLAR